MTHAELCDIGAKWLRTKCLRKCPVTLVEMVSYCPERPDVIGFNADESILIEVKTSKSDFRKDSEKHWRKHPEDAVGNYRYYLCPKGVISPEELPDHWGLLWVDKKGAIQVVVDAWTGYWERKNKFAVNKKYERHLLYSALRRITNRKDVKGLHIPKKR